MDWTKVRGYKRGQAAVLPPKLGTQTPKRAAYMQDKLARLKQESEERRRAREQRDG